MNGHAKTRSTISASRNYSIQKQISRQARGICAARSNTGQRNRIRCPSRLPSTTRGQAGPNDGAVEMASTPCRHRHFSRRSIFLGHGSMSIQSSHATNSTSGVGECDLYPPFCGRCGNNNAIAPGALPERSGYKNLVSTRTESSLSVSRMTKAQIAQVLEEIGTLLELKRENPFKIRAYANAARSIDAWGGSLSDLQDEEALAKIPGIGKAIAAKIKELATTGSLTSAEDLRAEFPPAILELFSIPGLGAKKIKALYDKLHISSIAELLKACESGRVAELPGFGEMTQAKICTAIEQRAKHSGYFQFGQIATEAESLRRDLAAHPDALQVDVAGSYRRRREIVRDVDLVLATKKPAAITEFFIKRALAESIIAQGPTKTSVRLRSGIQCDLRVVTSAEYPFALNYFTGSKEHNIEMRSRALQRGWT